MKKKSIPSVPTQFSIFKNGMFLLFMTGCFISATSYFMSHGEQVYTDMHDKQNSPPYNISMILGFDGESPTRTMSNFQTKIEGNRETFKVTVYDTTRNDTLVFLFEKVLDEQVGLPPGKID